MEEEFESTVEQIDDDKLALGFKIPSSVKTPISYLDSLRQYNDIYNDIYKQMEIAWRLYKFNGIIGNAVDVLVDFAVTDVWAMETNNKKLDKILEHFFHQVNYDNSNNIPGIYPLMQEIALEWFTSGNAFPYTKWDNVDIDGVDGIVKLPTSITLLNPQIINIPNEYISFGQEVIYLKPTDNLLSKLKVDGRSDPEAALLKQAIPRSIVDSMKNSRNAGFGGGIRLNPKFITHLKRKVKGYHAWGVPYLSRCFVVTSLIERLRQLDESISSGLINLVTIFKVGTEEHPASPARLKAFANLIRNPKATTTLVWPHDIDILQVGPDGKVLAFKDKYKDCKEDLLISLGIPPVLMSLSQQGNEWVAILSLVEKLSNWRQVMSIWLEKICNQIAENNGFNERVNISWSRMNLRDESSIKNLILAFYDRGLISINTALQQSGYDINVEEARKKDEKDTQDLFVPPQLPFSKAPEVKKARPSSTEPGKTIKPSDKEKSTINLTEQKKNSMPKQKEPSK